MGVFVFCILQYTLANTLLVLESPQNNKNSPSFHRFIATRFSRQQPLDGVYMPLPVLIMRCSHTYTWLERCCEGVYSAPIGSLCSVGGQYLNIVGGVISKTRQFN